MLIQPTPNAHSYPIFTPHLTQNGLAIAALIMSIPLTLKKKRKHHLWDVRADTINSVEISFLPHYSWFSVSTLFKCQRLSYKDYFQTDRFTGTHYSQAFHEAIF